MKILIAEDQPPAALYLRRTLEKMGHEATVAPDGEQAWQIVQQWRCTALDLRLDDAPPRRPRTLPAHPGRRGATATPTSSCLTSRDQQEDRLRACAPAPTTFLTKPPDPDELAVRLEIAERILAVHEQLARQNDATGRAGHDRRADRARRTAADSAKTWSSSSARQTAWPRPSR